jgi:hypothetical protein
MSQIFRLPYRVFIDLTPFIPLSLKGEGGRDFREGAKPPLLPILPLPLLREGVRGIGY